MQLLMPEFMVLAQGSTERQGRRSDILQPKHLKGIGKSVNEGASDPREIKLADLVAGHL